MKTSWIHWVWIVFLLLTPSVWAGSVPETGQKSCYDLDGNTIACPEAGQPLHGQDACYTGHTMSFTKLDSKGKDLASTAHSWAMVRDNVTGLIWEMKSDKDGAKDYSNPHDADNIYTWYDSNPHTNGGDSGTPGIRYGTDTSDFLEQLNDTKYGGYSDWRLPTMQELFYLLRLDVSEPGPAIETAYFSPAAANVHWTATTYDRDSSKAWQVCFGDSYAELAPKSEYGYARAVRGTSSSPSWTDNGNGTVTDSSSGLTWQQGESDTSLTFEEALDYCENLDLGGRTDWRLPNLKELMSIVDTKESFPAINTTAFPDMPEPTPILNTLSYPNYWSSTTQASYLRDKAWSVDFGTGGNQTGQKGEDFSLVPKTAHVRAVRGGLKNYFSPIGTKAGVIQAVLPLDEIFDLVVNSTNPRGDVPQSEWLLLTICQKSWCLPIYLLSGKGLSELEKVLPELDQYTFPFDPGGSTQIARFCLEDLGLTAGDTFLYGYAYQNQAGAIFLDNIGILTAR